MNAVSKQSRSTLRRVLRGGVLTASFVVAGALFLGLPAMPIADDLPDPNAMAAIGQGRKTSAEIVDFWSARTEVSPSTATWRLATAQLTLAGDVGDLDGYGEAETTARAAVALSPNNEGPLLALASARAGQHDFATALALAQQVLEDDPTSIGGLLAAGDASLELGNYADARTNYDRATSLIGGAAPVISRHARLESIVGSLDQARSLARKALIEASSTDLRSQDAAFYWFQLASFEFATGRLVEAEARVSDALSIDPNHNGSLELLAKTQAALGEIEGAIAGYEQLVESGGAADLHGELAKLYALDGRHDDAREQVRFGLARAEHDADRYPAERRHLIGFLADHDPVEALRLAELDLNDRQDVHAHAWYAWSLFKNGQLDAASKAIEPALEYGTEDAWLLYQAGSIRAANGDTDEAIALLRRALDLNATFDLVHAYIARELVTDLQL